MGVSDIGSDGIRPYTLYHMCIHNDARETSLSTNVGAM
jgi:hypothetical protein